jgi:hypothetical protein
VRLAFRLGGPVLLALVLAIVDRALAGPSPGGPPPEYPQVGLPDAAQARSLLEQFRGAGLAAGDFYVAFDLTQMPRHGAERTVPGRLWGGKVAGGVAMRIEIGDAPEGPSRLLVRNGAAAAVWTAATAGGGGATPVLGAAVLDPISPGIEITPFDLQMPYLYWPDVRVTGLNRIRGRPAYAFLFRPPSGSPSGGRAPAAVRVYIDTEFDRPLEVDLIGADGALQKTLSLLDLKKVDGQWLLSEFDVRNEITRDKTRFQMTAAALGLAFGPGTLSPSGLERPAAIPSPTPGRRIQP